MAKPNARCEMLKRTWGIIILLRQRSLTLDYLARFYGVSTRTIRRDLEALQALEFPLVQERDGNELRWRLQLRHAWPIREPLPVVSIEQVAHG